jgi:hypothetical protein
MASSHDPSPPYHRSLQLPGLPVHSTSKLIFALECSRFVSSPVRTFLYFRYFCKRTHVTCILGRGLSLAPGVHVPEVIQKALDNPPARKSNRESMQRRRLWWLPYVVLEFDNNQVLIDAMAGDLANPVWSYRADLCVVYVR